MITLAGHHAGLRRGPVPGLHRGCGARVSLPRLWRQLTTLIKTRLRRMQYRPDLLDGFLSSTGLDLTPFCNPRN
jgi:hypothetical protein